MPSTAQIVYIRSSLCLSRGQLWNVDRGLQFVLSIIIGNEIVHYPCDSNTKYFLTLHGMYLSCFFTRPIKERRRILHHNMKEIPNRILFSEMKHINVSRVQCFPLQGIHIVTPPIRDSFSYPHRGFTSQLSPSGDPKPFPRDHC